MTDEQGNFATPVEGKGTSRDEGGPTRPWYLIPLFPAFGFSALSFLASRIDTREDELAMRMFNFLVIAPLWAAAAFLYSKGKARIVMAILAFLLPAAALSLVQSAITVARSTVSLHARTRGTMWNICQRIQEYVEQHQEVPPSLSSLPSEQDAFEKPIDGWGHGIQYTVDRERNISLVSYGADGEPGGDGPDSDITLRCRTLDVGGKLIVSGVHWIHNEEY